MFKVISLTVLLLLGLFQVSEATLGVDVSVPVSESQFSCLKSAGYVGVIIRAWESFGGFDTNAPATIAAAHSAGLNFADVYLFPCPTKNATEQVGEMIAALRSKSVSFGTIWMDIETNPSPGCAWPSDTTSNCEYISELLNAAQAHQISGGIYASSSMWSSIAGSCTSASHRPLWYAHYDNNPSFSDFEPFGGWTTPNMKQYEGDASECGIGVDLNYFSGNGPATAAAASSSGSSSGTRTSSSGSQTSSGTKTSSGSNSQSSTKSSGSNSQSSSKSSGSNSQSSSKSGSTNSNSYSSHGSGYSSHGGSYGGSHGGSHGGSYGGSHGGSYGDSGSYSGGSDGGGSYGGGSYGGGSYGGGSFGGQVHNQPRV